MNKKGINKSKKRNKSLFGEVLDKSPLSLKDVQRRSGVNYTTLTDLKWGRITCKERTEQYRHYSKKSLLNQKYAKAQINGLIKRLENRKQYNGDNAIFYSSFPNTTEEKIDLLLGKYKLVMKKSDLFIPSFPKEAIDIMKKYTSVTKKISGETPVYYVIAESKDFKKKEKKLDPILLVQSPFGFYFQILGAWDKELILLSEL